MAGLGDWWGALGPVPTLAAPLPAAQEDQQRQEGAQAGRQDPPSQTSATPPDSRYSPTAVKPSPPQPRANITSSLGTKN